MSDSESLTSRLQKVRTRLSSAAQRSGRSPASVRLVAVTKTRSPEEVAEVVALGVEDVGENRVQEAEDKQAALAASGLARPSRWHLVGHLQKNKAGKAVALFDQIQSVDSLAIGERIARIAEDQGKQASILLQVDLAGEATKFGLPEEELLETAEKLCALPALSLDGLMVLPPYFEDPEAVRPFFRRLRELSDTASRRELLPEAPELSMGMSHDFEVAIEEGATMIRVGTALFGPRPEVRPAASATTETR